MQLVTKRIQVKTGEARKGIHSIAEAAPFGGPNEDVICRQITRILAERAIRKGYIHIPTAPVPKLH